MILDSTKNPDYDDMIPVKRPYVTHDPNMIIHHERIVVKLGGEVKIDQRYTMTAKQAERLIKRQDVKKKIIESIEPIRRKSSLLNKLVLKVIKFLGDNKIA